MALAGCPSKAKAPAKEAAVEQPSVSPETPAPFAPPKQPEGGWQAYKVGVTIPTRDGFYRSLEAELKQQAAKYGVTLEVQSGDGDAAKQDRQVRDLIAAECNAIVVCPVDPQTVGNSIRLANDAHVPVLTVGDAATFGDVVCHVAAATSPSGEQPSAAEVARLTIEAVVKYLNGEDVPGELGG